MAGAPDRWTIPVRIRSGARDDGSVPVTYGWTETPPRIEMGAVQVWSWRPSRGTYRIEWVELRRLSSPWDGCPWTLGLGLPRIWARLGGV